MPDRSLFSFPKKIFIFPSKNNYQGTQQFKQLDSHQTRQARICCIFEFNGISVHLYILSHFEYDY